MRLTECQIVAIKSATTDIFGPHARVWLFGSRVHDTRRGGDVDLMVETNEATKDQTLLAASLSARVSRSMHGRRVDVVVSAPSNCEQAIQKAAREQGVRL